MLAVGRLTRGPPGRRICGAANSDDAFMTFRPGLSAERHLLNDFPERPS